MTEQNNSSEEITQDKETPAKGKRGRPKKNAGEKPVKKGKKKEEEESVGTPVDKKGHPTFERTTTDFEYKFTAKELDEKGSRLAELVNKKSEKEEAKKSMASDYKSQIDGIVAEMKTVSHAINKKCETRSAACYLKRNFKSKQREYYAMDKKTILKTEELLPSDFQLKMV